MHLDSASRRPSVSKLNHVHVVQAWVRRTPRACSCVAENIYTVVLQMCWWSKRQLVTSHQHAHVLAHTASTTTVAGCQVRTCSSNATRQSRNPAPVTSAACRCPNRSSAFTWHLGSSSMLQAVCKRLQQVTCTLTHTALDYLRDV